MAEISASNSMDALVCDAAPVSQAEDMLSVRDEARVFRRLRTRLARSIINQILTRARLRFTLVLFLSTVLWGGLFWVFTDGFRFIKTAINQPGMYDDTVRGVFGVFFACLWLMLLFSSGVVLYGSLFRSPEIAYLITTPTRTGRIFLNKFQEALLLTSWGFVLMGSPMLLSYGIVSHAPWHYYPLLLLFIWAFIYLPVALGAVACLLTVRFLPKNRLQFALFGGLLALAGLLWIGWTLLLGAESELLTFGWYQEVFTRLQITEGRLLPSWWLSTGLLEAARGSITESLLFLALMIANALFSRQLMLWLASMYYRRAYSVICGHGGQRRRARQMWIDRAAFHCLFFMPRSMRLLIVKDMRLFRRDPLQWSQFLIFFGLLALYFINIRRLANNFAYVGWVNMVSFLNLSVVGLLMSTFTTRFIFPMISLEGRRFWLLGLLPLKRDTILWSKFLFAAGGSIVPCALLIMLSDSVLRVSMSLVISHQVTCLLLCLGLSGIAVGIGARLPNMREQSPARIAAGFGGTLNLVVSTLYILAVVLLTAVPYHFYLMAEQTPVLNESSRLQGWLHTWFVLGSIGSVLIGIAATVVPLWIGFRAFRRLEF
jgi:ABC-2 type transport system permease protein